MADPQGFSATKFIKKQYNKDTPSVPSNTPPPEGDNNKQPEVLSSDAIKTIINQYLSSADKHIKDGRLWEAIGVYKAALHLAPQDLDILQNLANTYLKANAREETVDVLTKVAGVYERQGMVEKVNDVYEKIYGIDPSNKLACSVLGRKPEYNAPNPDMFLTPATEETQTQIEEQQPVLPETLDSPKETIMETAPLVIEQEPAPVAQVETQKPVEENIIVDKVEEPVVPVAKISEDDIPTVIRSTPPTQAQMEGPKPIEEVIPLEKLSAVPPTPSQVVHVAPKEKVIDTTGPKPIEEMIPLEQLVSIPKPVEPKEVIKVIDSAGPKPVEEIIPFDNLKTPTAPVKPPAPVEEKIVVNVEPKSVEELIPFPPMPEKKVEAVQAAVPEKTVEAPEVKEEFPLPLPELKVTERKSIEMPMPEKKAEPAPAPPISSLAPANERTQYYLDILAMDPENIDARLNYINAYMEIGMELELVDDYLELANCYHDQGDLVEARKYYEKVLELNPNIITAKRRLAIYNGDLSPTTPMPPPQMDVAPPAPAPIPSQATAFSGISSSSMEPKDQALVTQFKRLLQINPINEPIARKLANFYIGKNMKKEAVAEMTSLADAYMQKGMYGKAVPIYEECFKEDPTAELKEKLTKAQSLHKSMDAINQAIKSYKTELKV